MWNEQGVGLMRQRRQDLAAQKFKSRMCWAGMQNSWLYCTSEAHSGEEQTFSRCPHRGTLARVKECGLTRSRLMVLLHIRDKQIFHHVCFGCSSSERAKCTDAVKKPQWLDNARSKYRNSPSGPSLVHGHKEGTGTPY